MIIYTLINMYIFILLNILFHYYFQLYIEQSNHHYSYHHPKYRVSFYNHYLRIYLEHLSIQGIVIFYHQIQKLFLFRQSLYY